MTIYLELTAKFNAGRLRAVLAGGQAVVLHRLAILSKDGDWILREDEEALQHVLGVLASYDARYRFGAPLEPSWMRGGWSSHFQFQHGGLRVRTDFFTRPPRLSPADLQELWREQEGLEPAFVGARMLAEMKKTDREKDYVVLGELARLLVDPRERLLYSRSARDLIELAGEHPQLIPELIPRRQLLSGIRAGRDRLEEALDAERRALIHANERRLECYLAAAEAWEQAWPETLRAIEGLPLPEQHRIVVARARGLLPERVDTSP